MANKSSLRDSIKLASNFQYSINIAYDIANDEKIMNFIPTKASIELLEDLLLSTHTTSKDRARVLVGAYGKGKSHILLMLLSILNRKDKDLFSNLLKSIRDYKEDLYNFVEQYLDSKSKIMPVIIQGSNASITQSLLSGLHRALVDNDLEDIMPNTHFHAAVNTINKWEETYPETFKTFTKSINKPINEFVDLLNNYDPASYKEFAEVFPVLTSGSEFNPFSGYDVVEIYESVITELRENAHSDFEGIYVVYDEFSKFLESGISDIAPGDIKLLQDFAEKCNRSGANQLHILLVSHKQISNYIDTLPKQKVDGWRGVSERFKHVEIHNNFSQIYEVIEKVINIDQEYVDMLFKINQPSVKSIFELVNHTNMYSELHESEVNSIVLKSYPLHPVSTFMLPRISEKVAQNERTIFTFLSSNQKNTLFEFINNAKAEFSILTPDYIYDYFEPLFKREVYTSNIYKTWKLANGIINKLDVASVDDLSIKKKIVKTIALIYIVEQFDKISPYSDVLISLYTSIDINRDEVTKSIEELISKQYVVYQKESNQFLKLKESSGIDIEALVDDTIEKNRHLYNAKVILNNSNIERYLYPVSYNDDNEITRYFDVEFISHSDFVEIKDWTKELDSSKAVGKVYAIINPIRNYEYTLSNTRIVVIVTEESLDVESLTFRYQALKDLREKYKLAAETSLCQELDIYLDDLKNIIDKYINSFLRPEARKAQYFFNGEKLVIHRKSSLTKHLSKICKDIYLRTPIINNELINRDRISSQVLRSRNKVISGMLQTQLKPNLGLVGYGQDVTIMRTVLVNTGILINSDTNPQIKLFGLDDNNIQHVIEVINEMFHSSSEEKPVMFSDLYSKLISSEYGIGLKRGIIPILIAAVLHHIKQGVVVMYRDKEVEVTASVLTDINNDPTQYKLFLEGWNEDKRDYINQLEEIFNEYVIDNEKDYNAFSYIMRAMQRWYIGLPSYSRDQKVIYTPSGETKPLPKEVVKFKNSLKHPSINARNYLFDKLFKIFGYKEMTNQLVVNIKHSKDILDNAVEDTINALALDLRNLFSNNDGHNASLSSILLNWYDELGVEVKERVFDSGEDTFLKLISSSTSDEIYLLNRLAKASVGLRVNDWDDTYPEKFILTISEYKSNIEDKNNNKFNSDDSVAGNSYTIILSNEDQSIKKTFSKVEYSDQAKILLTDLTSTIDDEYGDSISESEKRQVLMDILSTLIR